MAKIQIILKDGRNMTAELYPEIAPNTVANFIELCEAGFYNGLCFHRVIKNFMIQGGGFENGVQNHRQTGYCIAGEFNSNGFSNKLSHTPGVLSMARTNVKNSASSQFFICVDHVKHLDGEYAAFGKLSDEQSLSVAIAISQVQTIRVGHFSDVPAKPIVIERIIVLDKGKIQKTQKLSPQ